MYRDVITLFCRYQTDGKLYWIPHVMHNVDFNADKARILSVYGENSQDRAILHMALRGGKCNGSRYVYPKEYSGTDEEFTLRSGKEFDFFMVGEYSFPVIVDDGEYKDGFYNYINKTYDNVFIVTSASQYSVIPHIEVTAR